MWFNTWDLFYLPKILENFNCNRTLLIKKIKNTLSSTFIQWYLLSTAMCSLLRMQLSKKTNVCPCQAYSQDVETNKLGICIYI